MNLQVASGGKAGGLSTLRLPPCPFHWAAGITRGCELHLTSARHSCEVLWLLLSLSNELVLHVWPGVGN